MMFRSFLAVTARLDMELSVSYARDSPIRPLMLHETDWQGMPGVLSQAPRFLENINHKV